jgi:predicted dehydrogenase
MQAGWVKGTSPKFTENGFNHLEAFAMQTHRTVDGLSRRNFLAGTASLAISGAALMQARAAGANERIRLGIIGCGGRGTYQLGEIEKLISSHNVEVTAVCDVWKPNREKAAGRVKEKFGKEPFACSRYPELLGRKDVDAVIITTPDHAHSPILAAAAKAKKDAFCEKPMANHLEDAIAALDAVKENGVVCQIGTQRRSEGNFKAAAKLIQSGVLGTVSEIDTAWHDTNPRWARAFEDVRKEDVDWEQYLMGLPMREFDPRRYRCWHLYRDYTSGLPGLLGSHVTDIAAWFMDDPLPLYGSAVGGIYVWKDGREHCDTIECLWEFPKGFLLRYANRLGNNRPTPEITVYGTKGSFDSVSWKITSEGGGKDKISEEITLVPEPTESHMANFLECMRSRKAPNAPIEAGYAHSVASILASEAQRRGKQLAYDAEGRTFKDM